MHSFGYTLSLKEKQQKTFITLFFFQFDLTQNWVFRGEPQKLLLRPQMTPVVQFEEFYANPV